MIIARRNFAAVALTGLAMMMAACDGGSPSRTADEFAADSALAADLALANRDTLLVDSIGAYRPPEGAVAVPEDIGSGTAETTADFSDAVSPPGSSGIPNRPAEEPVTADPAPSEPAPAAAPVAAPSSPPSAPPTSAARLSGTRACTSASLQNQNECLKTLLPGVDARLNRIYRALITEMRRQEGVRPNGRDPVSVQRLRVAQRSWLVYRDNECRKRGRGREGTRWARPRVRCLGQFANRRANELADDFSKLTAR